jgi:hypothetical protein
LKSVRFPAQRRTNVLPCKSGIGPSCRQIKPNKKQHWQQPQAIFRRTSGALKFKKPC